MTKDAVVILGAGAACDVVSLSDATASRPEFRPPLTEDLFSPRFQSILNKYPDASALAETIRVKPTERSLESLLRELADDPQKHIAAQFKQVPLYLQELMGEVSEHYTTRPSPNYTHLISRLLGGFKRVAFVTLNYDLLLERVLTLPSFDGPITDMNWYVRPEWLLVKAHGSVNWGRKFLAWPDVIQSAQGNHNVAELSIDAKEHLYLDLLRQLELTQNLSDEVHILRSHQLRWKGDEPYYPALAVPVEGKYGLICPPPHVETLAEFLRTCVNVLVVGFSAKDKDLLELMRDSLPRCTTFFLVGKGHQDVTETNSRLVDGVPQLRAAEGNHFQAFHNGFDAFVRNAGVEHFVDWSDSFIS